MWVTFRLFRFGQKHFQVLQQGTYKAINTSFMMCMVGGHGGAVLEARGQFWGVSSLCPGMRGSNSALRLRLQVFLTEPSHSPCLFKTWHQGDSSSRNWLCGHGITKVNNCKHSRAIGVCRLGRQAGAPAAPAEGVRNSRLYSKPGLSALQQAVWFYLSVLSIFKTVQLSSPGCSRAQCVL